MNLALAATEVERRRVPELSAGYNSYSKTWEVIVQYQGDLAFLEEQGVRVTLLLFSYAILLVPESLMDYVTGLPQITYLEKPKLLYFADAFVRSISCITPVQEGLWVCLGMGCCLHALIQAWTMRILISAHRTDKPNCNFMGSDDSGKAGRITGAGDAAESDIATESDNAGGNGRYGIWEDTGWISHRD